MGRRVALERALLAVTVVTQMQMRKEKAEGALAWAIDRSKPKKGNGWKCKNA